MENYNHTVRDTFLFSLYRFYYAGLTVINNTAISSLSLWTNGLMF